MPWKKALELIAKPGLPESDLPNAELEKGYLSPPWTDVNLRHSAQAATKSGRASTPCIEAAKHSGLTTTM